VRERIGRPLLYCFLAGCAVSGFVLHFLPQPAAAAVQVPGLTQQLLHARGDTVQDVILKGCAGESVLLGTITATGGASTTNVTTAASTGAFAIPGGAQLCIQCDAAAAVAGGLTAAQQGTWSGSVTATMGQATTGKRIAAFDFYPWTPQLQTSCSSSQPCLAIAGVIASTLNCSVFKEL